MTVDYTRIMPLIKGISHFFKVQTGRSVSSMRVARVGQTELRHIIPPPRPTRSSPKPGPPPHPLSPTRLSPQPYPIPYSTLSLTPHSPQPHPLPDLSLSSTPIRTYRTWTPLGRPHPTSLLKYTMFRSLIYITLF